MGKEGRETFGVEELMSDIITTKDLEVGLKFIDLSDPLEHRDSPDIVYEIVSILTSYRNNDITLCVKFKDSNGNDKKRLYAARDISAALIGSKWRRPKQVVTTTVDLSHYPHICRKCKAPAYEGMNKVDCSNKDCK
jgi:hypothetical protein